MLNFRVILFGIVFSGSLGCLNNLSPFYHYVYVLARSREGKNFMGILAMRQQKGLTLIEAIVVIAIISTLASVAIPMYLDYQKKAKVRSYAEPIARACVMELVAYCAENPGSGTISPVVGPDSPALSCRNTSVSTEGGIVTLTSVGTVSCQSDGSLTISSLSNGGRGDTLLLASLEPLGSKRPPPPPPPPPPPGGGSDTLPGIYARLAGASGPGGYRERCFIENNSVKCVVEADR